MQAAFLADLVAVADATPVAEFAQFEISAALTLTRQAACSQLGLAVDLVRRLPEVHGAMAAGDLDFAKARVFSDVLSAAADSVASTVAAAILPAAPSLTTAQLRDRLRRLLIKTDPESAATRHQKRAKSRRLVLQPGEESCAAVLGLDLPADRAVAAHNRVSAIARAVKRAGDPRSLDQLRADTFLDLLLGEVSGKNGGVELVADLQTLAGLARNPGHLNGYGPVIADIARQVAEQQRQTPWSFAIYDPSGDIYTGTTRHRPSPADPPRGQTRPGLSRPAPPGSGRGRTPTGSGRGPGSRALSRRSAPPDGSGRVSGERPSLSSPGSANAKPSAREAICERAAEVIGSQTGGGMSGRDMPGGGNGTLGVKDASLPGGGWKNPYATDLFRRHPGAALARHIRARDRTCRAPGCRRAASGADLDHTIAVEDGGSTEPGNLGALCRFHHRAKHQGRWKLRQVRPGIFVWVSPLGRYYIVKPPPPPLE